MPSKVTSAPGKTPSRPWPPAILADRCGGLLQEQELGRRGGAGVIDSGEVDAARHRPATVAVAVPTHAHLARGVHAAPQAADLMAARVEDAQQDVARAGILGELHPDLRLRVEG